MNKGVAWFIGLLAGLVIGKLLNEARKALARTAPMGYEDEEGFHFGTPFDE